MLFYGATVHQFTRAWGGLIKINSIIIYKSIKIIFNYIKFICVINKYNIINYIIKIKYEKINLLNFSKI